MALTKLQADVNNIQKLSDRPNETDGLTSAELKERFDKAGSDIKRYINEILTEELDTILSNINPNEYVKTNDSRLTNSRQCNNNFDSWLTARANLKINYGTALPSSAENGALFFLYK